tara:strand:- start:596 stop:892 length:297 start_codon:yes stop_codon:yes gene_type:complete
MIHDHSKEAYDEEVVYSNRASKRCAEILEALEQLDEATDRQIKIFLGYQEMNHVRPRITELIKAGRLVESRSIKCVYTRKTVRVVKIAREAKQMEMFR